MCLCASSAPTVGRDYLLNAIIGPDGWPDYFVNLHLRVFFVSVSTIFVWVASLMFSLYRRGCFAAISRSKHFRRLRWRKCLMIKEFSGTPRTPSGGFAPCTPLTAENVYRKYNNPRIPSGGFAPCTPYFTLASRASSCSFCLRFSSRTWSRSLRNCFSCSSVLSPVRRV